MSYENRILDNNLLPMFLSAICIICLITMTLTLLQMIVTESCKKYLTKICEESY